MYSVYVRTAIYTRAYDHMDMMIGVVTRTHAHTCISHLHTHASVCDTHVLMHDDCCDDTDGVDVHVYAYMYMGL